MHFELLELNQILVDLLLVTSQMAIVVVVSSDRAEIGPALSLYMDTEVVPARD